MSTDRDSSIKIKKKLCENLETPLGVNKKQPRFSWLLDGDKRGTYQTAYQILVSSNVAKLENGIGDMWDSGKIESDKSINIKYKGQGLKRGTRYWWQVKCRDNKCRWSVDSDSSWFEMGLLEESEWTGTWIGAGENDNISAPLLRKRFTLEKKVDRARLYLSGLGYYELYLNGKSVGERLLDPSWTDYGLREMKDLIYPISDEMSHRVMYVTYDVTKFLQSGANIIGVMLGNGWYNQKERTTEGKLWYGLPRLLLQLNLKFKDGSRMEVGSDRTWKLASGPITFNNIYYGEVYDARREKEGWSEKNFDTSGWKRVSQKEAPGGKLVSQLSPPDRKTKKFQPESIYKPDKHTIIYDLGQNISGWVKIKVKGPEGNRVKLKFAEKLTENNHLDFDSTGGQDQIQKDVYILKGSGWEIYEPHFTWHGFRYVEITGEPELPEIDNIEGILVHTDVEQIGEFECSQPTFNKIFALYKWSQLTNLHGGVPSDCPHRERLGYTGDGQLTAESAIYCFDMVNFYRKWIDDIADSQGEESGHVQHTAPFYGGGGGPGAWGCAYILMPWYLYLYFGDTEILEKH
ncbi:MAG: family 78 glycoside hydrolase catalytic domain, partial [Halanaerobiaceae bacterium]